MKPLTGVELKRFTRDYRRQHPPSAEIALLLQSVEYPYNVGAIFRLADGAGAAEVVLSGITPSPPHPTIDKVGRLKSLRVPWRYEKEPVAAAQQLKSAGYHLVAVELVEGAVPYFEYAYPSKVALVVGNEDHGVTRAVLAESAAAVFIPMYGKGLSHNVATSLAIVLYHALHGGNQSVE